jgi:hypothetical protein
LEAEKPKVFEVEREVRPQIHRYRSAVRRLESCAECLSGFQSKYRDLASADMLQNISSAIALIEEVAFQLKWSRSLLVSEIHPNLRRSHDETSGLRSLFKPYHYELATTSSRAVEQYFWRAAHDAILALIEERKAAHITAMTRYKLVTAAFEAAGLGPVLFTTIKQFFIEHPRP